ncbi:Trk system potassium transporter TrkA [Halovenus rubra]|uniref:Trk system potassium transporter TrkA n=2 Tax=Halovenus rubra TaxID=869890 RepID=A0ACC7DZJ4_9EURY|nr:Trk system potassium transporter TrkA [Halovenus rubra]
MDIVIIGAGEVGTAIAEDLAPSHDVTIVDKDPDRAEDLKYQLDVLTMSGDGTSMQTLQTAETEDADLFIACTDDDRANLIACGTAKTLGSPFTIARTKSNEYLKTWEQNRSAFGVDFMVCSDVLTAEDIVRVIGLPEAIDIDPFAGGIVQMAEFEICEESPITGQTIAKADRFESLTFAGLFRGDNILIPSGETRIKAGDRAVVIGSPESVQSFAMDLASDKTPGSADEIVIVGGSDIGYHAARLLEERGLEPTLIEEDKDRARHLAEELPETLVMQHDPADTEFLMREHIDEADVLLAAIDADERDLLVAVLAKRLGVDRVVATVDNLQYVDLFEEIGIDVAINPREVTAEEIIRFSFESVAENLSVLEHDQAEVLEFELDADSELDETPIRELDAEISFPFVIGAVTRNNRLIPPRGETKLREGDHIVVFVETEYVSDLTCLA